MAAILAALVIGGVATAALLWPYGAAYVLIGSPLGASALALLVALGMATCRSRLKRPCLEEAPPPRTAVAKNDG